MQRRDFLLRHTAGLAGLAGWTLAGGAANASTDDPRARNKLVVVMLRGAIDGLSVVAPHAERDYYQSRPSIALAAPGGGDEALLPLDARFGLHPALQRLHARWERSEMAFVHASGSPDPTRSHFDAQDYLESGTPGRKSTPDGWMNRLLVALPGPETPNRAVNLGVTPPRILAGKASVATLGYGPRAFASQAIDNPQLQAALGKLYGGNTDIDRAYREATEGRSGMQRSMASARGRDMADGRSADPTADAGAPGASGFAADARRLGQLVAADPSTQLAFTAVGGWDTHANQGAAKGQLANRLASLGEGLDALAQGLGDSYRNTVIVVLSEFGRTLRQNGAGGTDHGRGNVIWLLGGPVAGGRVLGEWPGLESSALHEGRDLAVTTDFRAVLAPLLQAHLGLGDAAMDTVFPHYRGGALKTALLR